MEVIVDFIDANRDELGVEPICRDLQVAPSTYYAVKSRPLSARAVRDAMLIPLLVAIWEANFRVYGVRKLWKAARRAGHDVGRDQVARLMGRAGIEGLRRGKKRKTTKSDPAAERHPDLVQRVFSAERPNALWVSDLTYVATWSGFAYAYFITDAFSRMIVGWRVASHMRADMVLDALEMARWRRGTSLEGLVSHSDAGSQGGFKRSSQHLVQGGVHGTTAWLDGDSDGPTRHEVPGSATDPARRGASLLVEDRRRHDQRERCDRVWRVRTRRLTVVPRAWRNAIDHADALNGQIPILRRT